MAEEQGRRDPEGFASLRLTPGERRVLTLAAGLLTAAALLHLTAIPTLDELAHPLTVPWWIVAAIYYLTESNAVHIEYRQEAQGFSLNEIPLVVGFFFLSPQEAVLAALLGTVASLILTRHQRDLKLLFNTGHVWLGTVVAVLLFHTLAGEGLMLEPRAWAAAAVGALVMSGINVVAIFTAISLSDGVAQLKKLPQVATLAAIGTITTTSLALIGVTLMWERPAAGWLLAIPAATVYIAFRAYTNEKKKHESLEFLYESSRILHEYPEVEAAVDALLSQARETFRTELAEVTLFPGKPNEPLLRTTVANQREEPMRPVDVDEGEQRLIDAAMRGEAFRVVPAQDQGEELHAYIKARGLRDAMVAPLRGETRIIGAMLLGNRLGQVTSFREEELRLFQTLANQASVSLENGRLERTLSQLTQLKEELRHQAYHDTLTGLANRALFTERVEEAAADPETRPGDIAVLYLDLDDFKNVNDTYGHDIGDALLIEVATRVQTTLRPGDLAARLGGDEFAVLLRGLRSDDDAPRIAERIIGALRFPIHVADRDLTVRTSIGIAVNHEGDTSVELTRNADIAMYRAKHTAKGRYAIYEPGMGAAVAARVRLREELTNAVANDEFVLRFQPLYELVTERLIGVEALIRWEHPDRGMISPDDFLSVAEETGLILPIGEEVLRRACEAVAVWSRELGADLLLTVNISAKQLANNALVTAVDEAITLSDLPPGSLLLEITEHDIMDNTEANLSKLNALKDLGIQLAIDDFGTGYSSLAYLRRFPVDIVKIAKPFVDGIEEGDEEGVLARAIIGLSRALGMRTIAEGIERGEQAALLTAWGCDIAQGFHYSRPLDPVATRELLVEALKPTAPTD